MLELQLSDELMDRIRAIDGQYHAQAYLFVLAALEYSQRARAMRGHISGEELAWACRDFAREQFGLTSRTVLSYWGVQSTRDIGRIVYVLIEVGLLVPSSEDNPDSFESVYDFEEAFEEEYPWAGVIRAGGVD